MGRDRSLDEFFGPSDADDEPTAETGDDEPTAESRDDEPTDESVDGDDADVTGTGADSTGTGADTSETGSEGTKRTTDVTGAGLAGADGTDSDGTGADAGDTTARVESVEPAVATYRFDPEGAPCEGCGAAVETRWQDDGCFVCTDCKEW